MNTRVIGVAGAIVAIVVFWLAWPSASTPAEPRDRGAPAVATTQADAPTDHGTHIASSGQPTRDVRVAVVGCREQAGAGVEVEALYAAGRELVAGRADASGRARLRVPGDGEILVRARLGTLRLEPVVVVDGAATVTACRAARVFGRVMDAHGVGLADVEVALVDARGTILDGALSPDTGTYSLHDGLVAGAALVVTSPSGTERRDLAALVPGEQREHDLVLGEIREVVGWVLDLHGAPQRGVLVTLRAEAFGSAWAAITDASGGFRFAYAPETPLRVDADGGELGSASSRVASSAATRREVSLVLEPTGTITVFGDGAEVEVRCYDPRCHGEDGLTDDLDFHYAAPWLDGDGFDPEDPPPWSGEETSDDDVETARAGHYDSFDAAYEQTLRVMEESLRSYDATDPRGSLVRMMRAVVGEVPSARDQLVVGLGFGEATDTQIDEMIHTLVDEMMTAQPEMLQAIAATAAGVQAGQSLAEAAERAEEELRATAFDPDADATLATGAEPWEEPLDHHDAAWQFDAPYDVPERAVSVTRVALGKVGTPIRVRGSFTYEVQLRSEDGAWRTCGEVFVHPGDDLVVRCGVDDAPAVVTGRVLDLGGRPLAGVQVSTDWTLGPATSGDDGRFGLEATVRDPRLTTLRFNDPSGRFAPISRRSINLMPGEQRDVGDVVIRTADERPPPELYTDYGGIGGLVSLDPLGVHLNDVEPDSPLAMYGVEGGDTILQIDGAAAAELPMDEILLRLRGEPGTTVALRVRTTAGALYEVDVLRDIVTPRARVRYDFSDYGPQ